MATLTRIHVCIILLVESSTVIIVVFTVRYGVGMQLRTYYLTWFI